MTQERCGLCNKSLERAALVRCHDVRCPLAQSRPRTSLKTMAGMGFVGIAMLAAILVLASPGRHARAEAATASQSTASRFEAATAQRAPELGGSAAGRWIASMFTSPKPKPDMALPPAPDPALPDFRAATRVQSFRCDTALSPSRALVCTHWDLATADYNLGLSYQSALARSRDPRSLRRAHLLWLRQLDRLGGDVDKILRHIEAFRRIVASA